MAESQAWSSATTFTLTERLAAAKVVAAVIQTPNLQRLVLIAVDMVAITSNYLLAVEIARLLRPATFILPTTGLVIGLTILWLLMMRLFRAYSLRHARGGSVEYKRTINASIVTFGLIGVVCYLFSYEFPRELLVGWIATGIVALCTGKLIRRLIMRRLHRHGILTTPVLVVGTDEHVEEIAEVLEREKWIGYRIMGAVTNKSCLNARADIAVLGEPKRLIEIIEATDPPVVIFAEGSFATSAEFKRTAWYLEQSSTQMVLAPTLSDISEERLEMHPMAGLPLMHVRRPTAVNSLRWLKRTIDFLGSAVALVLSSPILLVAMLAVRLEDRGPVFFRQRRVGLNGKEFDCLKLRSMCVDAEERLADLKSQNEGSGLLFKMKNDPRITTVGRVIRRYSIDELPQLWNILIGDMSLVGPRPALPSEVERYDFDTRRRLRVRPGLTGLWQVSGRSRLSWEDTVRLDLYYVDNWSFKQDLMILLKTGKAVVRSAGAY